VIAYPLMAPVAVRGASHRLLNNVLHINNPCIAMTIVINGQVHVVANKAALRDLLAALRA
jgi:hypothetical protein